MTTSREGGIEKESIYKRDNSGYGVLTSYVLRIFVVDYIEKVGLKKKMKTNELQRRAYYIAARP